MKPSLRKLELILITREQYIAEDQTFSHFLFPMRATGVQSLKISKG